MSVPKQPRQLMINLMYLVLLALLALNVSAEIMNAFLALDQGIGNSNSIVDNSNHQIMSSIEKQAKAYKKYAEYQTKAEQAREYSKELNTYLIELREELFANAGGEDPENPARPVRFKDKDIPSKILVEGGKGEILKDKIIEVRKKLLDLIDDEEAKNELAESLPLEVPEKPKDSNKNTWSESAFLDMPVIAVLPMITKLSNDVKTSETAILNYFFKKAKGVDIVLDEYEVVVSADNGYVIKGEDYNAEVFLGAYSSTNNNITVTIDGKTYPVKSGKAKFKLTPQNIGKKKYEAVIAVRNPLTNEVKRYKKTFNYEVGERSVVVSAERMNVLYIGVDNPIAISAAGTKTDGLRVNATGTNLQKINNTKYMAKPTKVGKATITVSGGGLPPTNFEYRVKRIPDPAIQLGRSRGGRMSPSEFKTHKGPVPILDNFDFDATCRIESFELVRVPNKNSPRISQNNGGKYNSKTQGIVDQVKHGDTYYFNDIKVRCPGDTHGRKLNGLIFNIK